MNLLGIVYIGVAIWVVWVILSAFFETWSKNHEWRDR